MKISYTACELSEQRLLLDLNGAPVQVKRSDDIGRIVIDNFKSACERYDKRLFEKNTKRNEPVGFLIAFSFGKGAIQEVSRLKNEENIEIKRVRVDEIVPISKKPKLTVAYEDKGSDEKGNRIIEFKAIGESEAGIEIFAWDWDYDVEKNIFKPETYIDKTGVQEHTFKPGVHNIAVKVIDNEGLDAVEIIRLKVNGVIKNVKI
jgi:site-specific DNA-methyltransferase (adenine-specific)